jgi:hypothetical protein
MEDSELSAYALIHLEDDYSPPLKKIKMEHSVLGAQKDGTEETIVKRI